MLTTGSLLPIFVSQQMNDERRQLAQTRPKAGLIQLCEFQTLTHSFKL